MQPAGLHLHPGVAAELAGQGRVLQLDRHDRVLVHGHPAGAVPVPSGGEVLQDPLAQDGVRLLHAVDRPVHAGRHTRRHCARQPAFGGCVLRVRGNVRVRHRRVPEVAGGARGRPGAGHARRVAPDHLRRGGAEGGLLGRPYTARIAHRRTIKPVNV